MSKKFDLNSYIEAENTEKLEYKEPKEVLLPKYLQEALGFKGIALGFGTMIYGLSNSSKTAVMLKVAAECQKQGILPILVITETKLDREWATNIGLNLDNCIVKEDLVSLEDVYDFISMKVTDVKTGRLPMDCMIFWDSVAGTPSKESFDIDDKGRIKKKYGPQKNAAVIGYYNPIIMRQITSTRLKECEHSVGLFLVNQAYIKPPDFPGAPITIVPNGGEKIWYPLNLVIEAKESKKLNITLDEKTVEYGGVFKLKVVKNHKDELSCSGEFVVSGAHFFENNENEIKKFKEEHKDRWSEELSKVSEEVYEE